MTDAEILKKAIEKAVKNGFQRTNADFVLQDNSSTKRSFATYGVIFSHDFAKAFWGSHKKNHSVCIRCGQDLTYSMCGTHNHFLQSWQYHLQQMVLSPEPLKYLEKFLE